MCIIIEKGVRLQPIQKTSSTIRSMSQEDHSSDEHHTTHTISSHHSLPHSAHSHQSLRYNILKYPKIFFLLYVFNIILLY